MAQLENNKEVVRRLYEETWNKGNVDVVHDYMADSWLRHDPDHQAVPTTPEDYQESVQKTRVGFPDFEVALDEIVAEGDMVAFRFTSRGTHVGDFFGVPATNKEMSWTGMTFVRVEDGKIREMWSSFDQYGMMVQLGLLPTHEESESEASPDDGGS